MKNKANTHFDHERAYIWELPVRFYHWINAATIVILCVTGYWIGNPPALLSSRDASFSYTFGWVRFIHFAAAYVFMFNFAYRIYWGFVGNEYANWRHFILHKKNQIREIINVLRVDILLMTEHPHIESRGHNQLASLTYFIMFLVFLFQVVSGCALYAPMSDWWLPDMFTWIIPAMGGDQAVRQWHHLLMWFFICFTIVHVYLVFYHDYVEKNGEVSSIVSGWKFFNTKHLSNVEQETPKKKTISTEETIGTPLETALEEPIE